MEVNIWSVILILLIILFAARDIYNDLDCAGCMVFGFIFIVIIGASALFLKCSGKVKDSRIKELQKQRKIEEQIRDQDYYKELYDELDIERVKESIPDNLPKQEKDSILRCKIDSIYKLKFND